MKNLFSSMFEGPDDPPEINDAPSVDTEQIDPPAIDEAPNTSSDNMSGPPTIDDTSPSSDIAQDNSGYSDDGYSDNTQQSTEEDSTTLDEKGEIFAKVKILKEYRALYSKIDDTLSMIDKIDLVQIGNNIKSKDISDIKDRLSDLMSDIYTTIVYEFQLQYKNLKVKMVEYSSRYVILVKSLVTIIKNDQK